MIGGLPIYLIGIAGPSGSGKTELARALAPVLRAPILALDSYYRDLRHQPFEERARVNFDTPEAIDQDLLAGQLRALAAGAEIEKPLYDFARHARRAEVERVQARGFAILEGLWALHWPEVRALIGTKVYVDAEDRICFERRLDRDVRERGRSPESVARQYAETVRPMEELYIRPQRCLAGLVVSGVDPVAYSADTVLAHIEHGVPERFECVVRARAALAI